MDSQGAAGTLGSAGPSAHTFLLPQLQQTLCPLRREGEKRSLSRSGDRLRFPVGMLVELCWGGNGKVSVC